MTGKILTTSLVLNGYPLLKAKVSGEMKIYKFTIYILLSMLLWVCRPAAGLAADFTNLVGMCKAKAVNVRAAPTMRSEVVGKIINGEKILLLEKSNLDNEIDGQRDYWYRCRLPTGQMGWVYGAYFWIQDSFSLSGPSDGGKSSKIRISLPQGVGPEAGIQLGQEWWALVKEKDGFLLKKTRVTALKDGAIDTTQDPQLEGLDPKDVMLLIRGMEGLREGPLNHVPFLPPDDFLGTANLSLDGAHYEFHRSTFSVRHISSEPAPKSSDDLHSSTHTVTRVRDYSWKLMTLKQGDNIEVLNFNDFNEDYLKFNVSWMGDLDRDGRLDAIGELSNGWGMLFLSSSAAEGRLLEMVANYYSGC